MSARLHIRRAITRTVTLAPRQPFGRPPSLLTPVTAQLCHDSSSRRYATGSKAETTHVPDDPSLAKPILFAIGVLFLSWTTAEHLRIRCSFPGWPESIRPLLVEASKAKRSKDDMAAIRAYQQVRDLIVNAPPGTFKPSDDAMIVHQLMVMGLYLCSQNRQDLAFSHFTTALDRLGGTARISLDEIEERRSRQLVYKEWREVENNVAISLAQVAGLVAASKAFESTETTTLVIAEGRSRTWEQAAMDYLIPAHAALLELVSKEFQYDQIGQVRVVLSEENWAHWAHGKLSLRGSYMTMAVLNALYLRRGEWEEFLTNHIEAIKILLPTSPRQPPTLLDRCTAARFMLIVSNLISTEGKTPAKLADARRWLNAALHTANSAIAGSREVYNEGSKAECRLVLSAWTFNEASLRHQEELVGAST